MRRLLKRVAAFYEKHNVAIDLALVAVGANAIKRQILQIQARLEQIENGGMVPLDDVVTLRDLERKIGPSLLRHEKALVDAGLVEPRPPAEVEPEASQGAPEAAGEAEEAPAPAEAPGAP